MWLKLKKQANIIRINIPTLSLKTHIYDFERYPDKKKCVQFCMVYHVHLVWMMYGYFKILAIVFCFGHSLNSDYKISLYTIAMEDWKNQVELLFYKLISSFGFQPCLNLLNITKFRYSMTKLRVSSHRLGLLNQVVGQNQIPTHLINESVCSVTCWKMSTILFWDLMYITL